MVGWGDGGEGGGIFCNTSTQLETEMSAGDV